MFNTLNTKNKMKLNLNKLGRLAYKWRMPIFMLAVVALGIVVPDVGYCTVEGTLKSIQNGLTTAILPVAAILGLIFSGLSFVAGSPGARTHLTLAIIGAIVGFGAQSIIEFIQRLVK